jgi:phospholipid/cholesterol/gamma-HCH transport system permease protein
MAAIPDPLPARASLRTEAGLTEVALSGNWLISAARPAWSELIRGQKPASVRLRADAVAAWDSSLLLFLFDAEEWCREAAIPCETGGLPERIRGLLTQLGASHAAAVPHNRSESFLTRVGLATRQAWNGLRGILQFLGECVLGILRVARHLRKFRWGDCLDQMQECGAMSLPIVSLISFLVGLTLAYQAAVELRQFGADIYVADIVGLSLVREMGPMMAAVILAGRVGAAFAATLGNMKANEEIDALEVLGLSAVDFLVLPRLLALGLMMPLLALYSNCVGILGGMVVAKAVLQIPFSAYWVETQGSIDLSDFRAGLLKATTFGLLIGLAGCLRGLQAERSAAGVGRAATSAVVTGILFVILADSVYAVVFHILGI